MCKEEIQASDSALNSARRQATSTLPTIPANVAASTPAMAAEMASATRRKSTLKATNQTAVVFAFDLLERE